MRFLGWALNEGIYLSMDEGAAAGSPPAATADVSQAGTEAGVAAQPEPGQGVNEPGGQRQSQHVPYEVFQPVKTQLTALNERARAAGFSSAQEYLEHLEAQSAYPAEDYYAEAGEADTQADPTAQLQQRLQTLEGMQAEALFERGVTALAQEFPDAARESQDVKAMLLNGQARTLREAMQKVQQKETARRDRIISEYRASLEERQGAGAEGAGGGAASAGVDFKSMPSAEFNKHLEKMGVV